MAGRRRVARLMRENGLRARQPRRSQRTTDSQHAFPVAPNRLDQDFTTAAPNEKWGTDLSYIWTREGWLYLAVVIDLYARRVVGWAAGDRLHKELALIALRRALIMRRPAAGLLHHSDRGGDVTYHGPGQLVGYPIVDLRGDLPGKKGPHLGPVDFVRLLEEALIRTSGDFGVMAQRICKLTGVWTIAGGSIPEKKVAAIGVHVSQGVTSHGFALNVTTDLRDFEWIIPCGLADRQVTSLELEVDSDTPADRQPTMESAANSISRNFGRVFERQMLWCDSIEDLLDAERNQTVV